MRQVITILIATFLLLAVVAGVLLATAPADIDLRVEVARALLTLMTAILITGVLSFVLSQRAAYQAELDNRERTMTGALRSLKSGYERVQVARFYLGAHPTARTFQEQISTVAESRSHFHMVQREQYILGTELDREAQKMLDYLDGLAGEYRNNYRELTERSLREEGARDRVRNGSATTLENDLELPRDRFPFVYGLINEEQWRASLFNSSYSDAKNLISHVMDKRDWASVMQWRRVGG